MSTKKTPDPKPIPQSIDNSKHVSNCNFVAVQWDAQAIATIQTVADGLLETAKAFHSLVGVFKAQNVQIEAMIRLEEVRTV